LGAPRIRDACLAILTFPKRVCSSNSLLVAFYMGLQTQYAADQKKPMNWGKIGDDAGDKDSFVHLARVRSTIDEAS